MNPNSLAPRPRCARALRMLPLPPWRQRGPVAQPNAKWGWITYAPGARRVLAKRPVHFLEHEAVESNVTRRHLLQRVVQPSTHTVPGQRHKCATLLLTVHGCLPVIALMPSAE